MVLRESPPSYRISLKDTSLKLYLKKKGVSQDQVFTFSETTYGIQLPFEQYVHKFSILLKHLSVTNSIRLVIWFG